MQSSIEEKIKLDIRSGKDPTTVRSYVNRQQLDESTTEYFLNLIDDQVAINALRNVKKKDARLIVYMGYFLMALSIFFGIYSLEFGIAILVVGFIVTRRGHNKVAEAMEIDAIEELLPDYATKFHKRKL